MRDCSEYCTFSISRVLELFSSAHKNTQTVEYPPFLMQVKDSVRMFEKMNFEKSGEGQSQRPASSASTSMGYLMHPPEGYHSSTPAKSQSAPIHSQVSESPWMIGQNLSSSMGRGDICNRKKLVM